MLIIVLILATAMTAIWFTFLSMTTKEDWIAGAYNKVLANLKKIHELQKKDIDKHAKLATYHGISAVFMGLILGKDSEKEIAKLADQNIQLQGGNLKKLGILDMPGYVLQRKYEIIGRSEIHKKILTQNFELYGKKHAENKTKQLLAKLISYPIIGVAMSFALGALLMGMGKVMIGITVLSIGTILVLVLVYALYDDLSDQVNKRRKAISRQFPNMVSKLALLVTSGMNMERAWKETAYSQDLELYKEMQKTSEELENLVSPEVAYGGFINRCNAKETAKLASAIIQNLSKGNAEIGVLLKGMAREAWLERRHMAKRDSEAANSKLMIPTMLLFLTILIMLMVPVAMNFTSI